MVIVMSPFYIKYTHTYTQVFTTDAHNTWDCLNKSVVKPAQLLGAGGGGQGRSLLEK